MCSKLTIERCFSCVESTGFKIASNLAILNQRMLVNEHHEFPTVGISDLKYICKTVLKHINF